MGDLYVSQFAINTYQRVVKSNGHART